MLGVDVEKSEDKLNQQTLIITSTVTKNVTEALNKKLESLIEDNTNIKLKITELEQKLHYVDTEKRKNNLVFFGVEEDGKREIDFVEYIKKTIVEAGTPLDCQEISNIYRISAKATKRRPIVVTFTTTWKKHLILKNKSYLPQGIYVKDYSKGVLETRKQLQPKVEEERKKGNIAYLKHDKLVVKKPNEAGREKRKRDQTGSPNWSSQKKSNTNTIAERNSPTKAINKKNIKEIINPNILNYTARGRSTSLSEIPKNQ
ncbi:unnamed protein product [Leptidea sinapis]|uniref:Endonuclease-reverse transcriptase n=1 Tax=Leptidea sinapis TaxID=189913 RepID=A0A5E4QTE5_9NEOP|nr:unnamed protein product [Leptidea sinapis]